MGGHWAEGELLVDPTSHSIKHFSWIFKSARSVSATCWFSTVTTTADVGSVPDCIDDFPTQVSVGYTGDGGELF